MKLKNIVSGILCVYMVLGNGVYVNAENISNTYLGTDNAQEIINNINFNDLKPNGNDHWAKEPIYKNSSLSIIKGYGDISFKPESTLTKAEALALIFRSLGREENAQREAERLYNQKSDYEKNNDTKSTWAEGYLSLARQSGLITQEQFDKAVSAYSMFTDFDPNSAATRQELAVWIAKAFNIAPVYKPELVFNNYKDFKEIDIEKIPYIEALLKEKIMNGDNGNFYPKKPLTRAEMAQILSNLEQYILKANSLGKEIGYIDDISTDSSNEQNKNLVNKSIFVRTSDGKLDVINVESIKNAPNLKNNEVNNGQKLSNEIEIVVNKDGMIGKSSLLSKNDEVEFVYDKDKKVKYVFAKSNSEKPEKYLGTIENVDSSNRKISFTDENGNLRTYNLSGGAVLAIDDQPKAIEDLNRGIMGSFTIFHGLITKFNTNADGSKPKQDGNEDTRGIIREINPALNYITLYGINGQKSPDYERTYKLSADVSVNRNGSKATLQDIEVGDAVYLKFNDDGKVQLINSQNNYSEKLAQIVSIGPDYINVKYSDGYYQKLPITRETAILKNLRAADKSQLHEGDTVKLLLNENNNFTALKQIEIQDEKNYSANVYKGNVFEINDDSIKLTDISLLNKERWVKQPKGGLVPYNLNNDARFYQNDRAITKENAKLSLEGKGVYFAVVKNDVGEEKVVMVSNSVGFEMAYNDKILSTSKLSKSFVLSNANKGIKYNDSTIITKNGRITQGYNLNNNDPVYIIALRDPYSEQTTAGVIQIVDKPSVNGIDIYRGKLTAIDPDKSFTVTSFSILKDKDWNFVNTPKTFNLSSQTRIVSSEGVINNHDFADYTNIENPLDEAHKFVYVVTSGTDTELISFAPYAIYNLKGEITNIKSDDTKTTLQLKNSSIFDTVTGKWNSVGKSNIDFFENSVIIKNSSAAELEDLNVGDRIRVIKKDNTANGEGYIILVEG